MQNLSNFSKKYKSAIEIICSVFMVILTLSLFVVGCRQSEISKEQSDISNTQSKILEQQLHVSKVDQRAWLSSVKITLQKIKGDIGPESIFNFEYEVKNTGKTPVKGLYLGAEIIKKDDRKKQTKIICDKGKSTIQDSNEENATYSIIPGGKFKISYVQGHVNTKKTQSEIDKVGNHALVAGCFVYGTQFDENMHYVQFYSDIYTEEGKIGDVYTVNTD